MKTCLQSIWVVVVCVIMNIVFAGGVVAEENSFIIGPGDVVEISVWKDKTLTRQVVVPPDGVISFPLIGEIDASRMTVADLRKNIKAKLTEYVPDAPVTVMLLQINSLKAYVIGKVNKPGEYDITMDTTVMHILAKAGGLNPFAAERKIHILRQSADKTEKIPFDYKEVLSGENLGQNILLKQNDIVVVP